MYKKITALFLVIVLSCIPIYAKAASQSIEIYVNGEKVNSDVSPIITKGRVLVPLRIISENLGANVNWDNISKTVTIKGSKNIILKVNNRNIVVDSKNLKIDVPAMIVQSRTMVPLRFISEILESKVDWDNTAKQATIIKKQKTQGDIVKFSYENIKGVPAVIVSGDAPLKYDISQHSKEQLTLDIKGGEVKTSNNTIYANDGVLKKAIIGNLQKRPPITRLILDFDSKIDYQIRKSQDQKTIYIYMYLTNSLENIELQSKTDRLQATIETSKPSDINYFTLQNPARLVLDIKNTLLKEKELEIPNNDFITDVRTSQFSKNPNVVRVVFDLEDRRVKYSVKQRKSNIYIDFYRTSESEDTIVQEPTDYKGKIVVIDPGHGGSDPGAVRSGVTEKYLNLETGLKLREILEQKGINVLMTRDKDIFVDLYVRAGIANDVGADAFVSIHSNTASATGATGIETLYYPNLENKKLALSIQKAITESTGCKNRGIVQRPRLVVTRETKMPSALVEVGFMSNPSDLTLLLDEDFRQKAAEGIATGIINFLSDQTD